MGGQRRRSSGSERSMAILLGGALTAVLAVCAVAGLFILRTAGTSPEERIEPVRSQQNGEARPRTTFTPLAVVPSACTVVDEETTERLVPGSSAQLHKGTETDEYSKCSWVELGSTGGNKELSIELRGGGKSVESAADQFRSEAADDKEGIGLLPQQKLQHFGEVEGVGEQAYELFLTERFQGQGIVHAQVGNVLLTVSYGGGTKGGDPLGRETCLDGAIEVAKEAVERVREAAA